ncbi:MAG: hypothetical protein CML66_08660 [Rhodobacteraceae bacterium]|nr:hypothetical protein [Paracoccaceae bacterium]
MARMPVEKAQKLQTMLNDVVKPNPPLKIDGIIGKRTKAALKLLQKKAGLKQSGEVDTQTAPVVARVQSTGKVEKEQPEVFIEINGKLVGLTMAQYETRKKALIADLRRGPLRKMMLNVSTAEDAWDYFDALNKDQWFVSFCIETTRRVNLPARAILSKARQAYQQCDQALSGGDLTRFHKIYPGAEHTVNDAVRQMHAYRREMIEGGDNWVTGLTFTRTASFTFVGVFAAPAVGATLGTGVVASAMIGGAAVSATQTAAGEGGKWSAGTEGWTAGGAVRDTVVDAGVGAILGLIGKGGGGGKNVVNAAADKVFSKLAAEQGFKLLSKTTVKKAALYMMTEGAKGAMTGAVNDAAKRVKGDRKITVDTFAENVAVNFVKGAAFAPFGKVISGFAGKAADRLDAKDKKKITTLVLVELTKQAKGAGKGVAVADIDARAKGLIDGVINAEAKKVLDRMLEEVWDKEKGPLTPPMLEKKMRDYLMRPQWAKGIAQTAAKEITKKGLVPAR